MIKALAPCLLLALLCGGLVNAGEANKEANGDGSPLFYGVSDGREQSASVLNKSPFYEDKERGWFWYEDPVFDEEPAEEEATSPPPPVQEKKTEPEQPAKPQGAKPLSAEWFRKNMEKYRDKAIDEPTQQNVSAYMYLQRVMLDKAEKFSEISQRVVMSDPVLDENSRRPIATFGAFAMDDRATKGTEKAAKKLAENAGLWFFYASTCEFCIKEVGVLKGLMNAYGFKVLPIALDGLPLPGGEFPDFTIDRGQAKKLGVETTPALFLVKPGQNGDAIQLGQGLLSGDEIIKRAITLAHQNGWLNSDEYQDTLKVKPMQVDTETLQNIDEKVMDKPNELVKTIRNNLRKQF
jgi:conjugal transfer pilus assembly protein TraF